MTTEDVPEGHILGQHVDAHSRHEKLIEEIASRVEEKLWSKVARFLVINAVGGLGIIIGLVGTYYNLSSRIDTNHFKDEIQDGRYLGMTADARQQRDEMMKELSLLRGEVQDIRRFLLEHSAYTANQRNGFKDR
jgi:hypothetical protein